MSESVTDNKRPLCVDLDGTLIRTDLLDEQLVVLFKRNPFAALAIVFTLFGGKAAFKAAVARRAADGIDVANLPYDEDVLREIRSRRDAGAPVDLVSGSDRNMVARIADHLRLFDAVLGSGEGVNLTGHKKAAVLSERYPGGFAYIGNGRVDVPVWSASAEPMIAQAPAGGARMGGLGNLSVVSTRRKSRLVAALQTMRIHQWVKNGLIFLPLLLTLSATTKLDDFVACAIGFAAFCVLSSGTYFLNDLLDVQADRRHPTKRNRAMASGALSLRAGGAIGLSLMLAGFGLGVLVGPAFLATLGAYTVLTACYSLFLKRAIALDVLAIAILFLMRAYAGAVATDQTITVWLASFLLFFFLALAIGKRVIELKIAAPEIGERSTNGRAYVPKDTAVMMAAGVAFSIASIMLFLIYALLEQHSFYHDSWAIVLTAGLLAYWALRFWILVYRDRVEIDPVAFVLKDPATFATVAAISAIALIEQAPRFMGT